MAVERVPKREPVCVERLAREGDRPQRVWPVDVALLADQRVAAETRLDADLIALAGDERHLDERRGVERLDDAVMADRRLAARIARARFLLYQCFGVPDQRV